MNSRSVVAAVLLSGLLLGVGGCDGPESEAPQPASHAKPADPQKDSLPSVAPSQIRPPTADALPKERRPPKKSIGPVATPEPSSGTQGGGSKDE